MKVKKLFKKIIITNGTLLTGCLPIVGLNNNLVMKNTTNDNSLELNISDNEINKISNIDFRYYQNKENKIYITEESKFKIAKKIIYYMLNNENDYFSDAVSSTTQDVKKYFINNPITKLKYSVLDENFNWKFYYLGGETNIANYTTCIKGPVKNALQFLKWNNIGNNQYTISLVVPVNLCFSLTYKTDEILNDTWNGGTFMKISSGNYMDVSFKNIIFEYLPEKISKFNYKDIDLMDLTNENLKSLFLLNNSLLPYEIIKSIYTDNFLYYVNVTKIIYKIKGNQNFTFIYEGNYEISFVENNYSFDISAIESTLNAFELNEETFFDSSIINSHYKKYIKSIDVKSDYNNSQSFVSVNFDTNKAMELVFYDYLKDYFVPQKIKVDFSRKTKINFTLKPENQNILLKNFKNYYINAWFDSFPYTINILKIYDEKKDYQNNNISFIANIEVLMSNKKFYYSISGVINNFEYYNFLTNEKIESFFNDNFYDSNGNLELDKIQQTFNNQEYWSYICTHSKNLIFENLEIKVIDNKLIDLSFDVFNNKKIIQDKARIQFKYKQTNNEDNKNSNNDDKKDNNQNEEQKSITNKKYYFLLLLLILLPMLIFVLVKIFKKLKKNRNKI